MTNKFSKDQNGWVWLIGSNVIFLPEKWKNKIVYRMYQKNTMKPAEIWEMHGILRQIDQMWEGRNTRFDEDIMKLIDKDLSEWVLYLENNVIKQWEISKDESRRLRLTIESQESKINELKIETFRWRICAWVALATAGIFIILALHSIS